jgi:hypothetical protein
MAESHLVNGLLTLRSELIGKIEYAHKQISTLNNDIAHVEAAIKLVAPHLNLTTNKPKEYRVRLSPFRNGEVPVLILDILRQSNMPLSTSEIAYGIAKARGLPEDKDYDRVVKPIHSALQRMRRNGFIEPIGKMPGQGGGAILWKIID